MSESHTRIADEIFVAAGRFIPYFTDAGITHGDIETYPEDWDAITRALGAEPEGATGANSLPPGSSAPSRFASLGSYSVSRGQASLRERAQADSPCLSQGPSRFDMEDERLRLERLGRQIAFYLGTSLLVVIFAAAILGGLRW